MSRPLGVFLLIALPSLAHADTPNCEAESRAVKADEEKAGRDPALRAPTDRQAKEHMSRGTARHREGLKLSLVVGQEDAAAAEFQAAVEAYRAGALIDPSGLLLYNLAQSYRALGDYDSAIGQYRRILDRARPREPLRRLIECYIANMIAEQERAARTAPPRDAMADDPDPTGGAVAAEQTSGDAPPSKAIDLQLGERVPSRAPWYADGLGWGIAGTGIVTAGLGAYFLLDASHRREKADREDRDDVRIELRAEADSRQTWGTVASVAGGAFLVAGVVKLAITPDAGSSSSGGVSLRVSPGGFALGGRF